MKILGNIVLAVIVVLSLPVVIAVMVLRNFVDERYQKRIANKVPCEKCGNLLGEAGLLESNRVVAKELKELQAKHPGIKFRRIRKHHAICIKCGQEYFYSNQGKTYLPVVPK